MIRLGRLYIHLLTIALFIVFFLNGHLYELCAAYISMLAHETAHLCAAVLIGLNVSRFVLYPFGVCLKLKNKMTARIADDVILYLAGPLMNILIALAAMRFCGAYPRLLFFYRVNIMLFFTNMLPVAPLDGGCLMKRIISGAAGIRIADIVMRVAGIFITLCLAAAGVYVVCSTGYNYSVLVMAVFMIGNIFTQKEKYNTEFVRELMFYRGKPLRRIKVRAAYSDEDMRSVAKKFLPCSYSIVCFMDRDGKIKEVKSERQIIDDILENK